MNRLARHRSRSRPNTWKAGTALFLGLLASLAPALELSAQSALIVDADTGKILFEKDAYTQRHPASTTKIMTSLLLIEHCTSDEIITAPGGVEKVPPSTMNLKMGEEIRAEDLLYSVMLRSANDGAYAAAVHVGGSEANFARMMNERAKRIGANSTNFVNPHGLTHTDHLSTAYDLSLIAREAMKYGIFREVARTQERPIQRSLNQKDVLMTSRNKWLFKDVSADGIKTGYTRAAGLTYVGSATRDGYRIITVILKSENWQKDHQAMLNWAFENHEARIVHRAGEVVAQAAVPNGKAETVPVAVDRNVRHVVRRASAERLEMSMEFDPELKAPIERGQRIGTATFQDGTGWSQSVPLIAKENVDEATFVARIAGSNTPYAVLGGALVLGACVFRVKVRRPRFYGQSTA
jgi:serine-type D-Ala-D-Ala carboxypeptidase (penicillin-binding protein 5/6)